MKTLTGTIVLRRPDELGLGRHYFSYGGNTCGVTFPPILVHPGQPVDIRPISPNRYILTFGK